MARIRSVHPDICKSETMAGISASAERTFVRLWTACDDEGRAEAHPKLLKAALYPLHDDMTPERILVDLRELSVRQMVQVYDVEGKSYLAVRSWTQYQHPAKPTPSKIPAPPPWNPVDPSGIHFPENSDELVTERGSTIGEADQPVATSPNGQRGTSRVVEMCQRSTSSLGSSGIQWNPLLEVGDGDGVLKEARSGPGSNQSPPAGGRSGSKTKRKPRTADPPGFVEFWERYPKRNGERVCRQQAVAEWMKLTDDERPKVMVAVANYAKVRGGPGQMSPKDAFRWLKDDLWEDYVGMAGGPISPDEPQPLGRCEHCRATLIRGHNPDTCVLNPNRVTA